MKKLLYIAPHLSTGGLPQYLNKKIQLLINEFEIYLVEWVDVTGGRLVVQRDQLKDLIPENRFFTLSEKELETKINQNKEYIKGDSKKIIDLVNLLKDAINFVKKEVAIGKSFFPTGNYDGDLNELLPFFKGVKGKIPENGFKVN
jgi:hypothetical protein